MKTLFAVYDSNDNFIKCSFSLLELGVSSLSRKLYRIPLDVQDDCFKEEDEAFLREFSDKAYTVKEQAKRKNVSERTIYRHKKRRRRANKNEISFN